MEIKISLFVTIILSVCQASVSLDEQSTSCTKNTTEVTVTPTSLEDILALFSPYDDIAETLRETLAMQAQIIVDSLLTPFSDTEDQDLNATQLITKYGFTPEVHEVTTKDGYELSIHRIVGNGPVVFMMHGIECSTDEWLTPGPDNSLAFALASAGYDVWMGNARGNKYSMKHVSLSPECDEFWLFSVDEISLYDLPIMIDYALNFTGKSNLSFVGFAQGVTNLVSLCSDIPEYNEKISVAVFLAPTIYVSHWKSPLFRLISLNPEAIYEIAQLVGLNKITDNGVVSLVEGFICGNNPISKIVCSNILSLLFGYGHGQLNIERLPVFISHLPAGASMRQIIHYGQLGRTGKFQKFDFTKEKNLEVYGSEEPPQYKPENVTVPVVMFYGEYDWIVNVTDVNQLLGELPNVVNATYIQNYGHLDQLLGKNCKEIINEPAIELISKYQT